MKLPHRCKAMNPATCKSSRCPERKAIAEAFRSAVHDEDYQAMFSTAADMEKFEPAYIRKALYAEEWDKLFLKNQSGDWRAISILSEKIEHSYNTSAVPSFDNFEDISTFFTGNENILFSLIATSPDKDEKVHGWTIHELFISPALRGQGVGQWMMNIVTKHADKTNALLFLTPTSAGDKKIDPDHPHYKQKALQHRERITRFYNRHGFISNPFWIPIGWKDELTGEEWSQNETEMTAFSSEAAAYLSSYQTPQLVRIPKQGWPARWKKET